MEALNYFEVYSVAEAKILTDKNGASYLETVIVPKELDASNYAEQHKLLFFSEIICKMWQKHQESPTPQTTAFFENIRGRVSIVEGLDVFQLKNSKGEWTAPRTSLKVFGLTDKMGVLTISPAEEARKIISRIGRPVIMTAGFSGEGTVAGGGDTTVVTEEQKPKFDPITGQPL